MAKIAKARKRKSVQYDNWGYFFIAPFFLIYLVFSLIPLLTTFYYSFTEHYRDGMKINGPNYTVNRYFKGFKEDYERQINNAQNRLSNFVFDEASCNEAFTYLVKNGSVTPDKSLNAESIKYENELNKIVADGLKYGRDQAEIYKEFREKAFEYEVFKTVDCAKRGHLKSDLAKKVQKGIKKGLSEKEIVSEVSGMLTKRDSSIAWNFEQLFNDPENPRNNMGTYFLNTIIMWIMGFVPQILVSLILAVWFTNTELKLKCQQFFKTVIYMPNLIMASAFAMLFFTLFSPNGPINSIFASIINKANIPNVDKLIAGVGASLDSYAANVNTDSVSTIVTQIKEALIPFGEKANGLDLAGTNTLIKAMLERSGEIAKTASDMDKMNLFSILAHGLQVGPEPWQGIRYFSNTWWARSIIASMNFLMWYGNTTILLMAGVMGIDNSLFEAARIDGANPVQIFFKVTIPLLLPIFVYVLITSLIGGIQMFDVPQIITNGNGGPDRTTLTIIMKLNNLLGNKNNGLAGAASILIFAVTGVLSGVVYKTTMAQYTNKR